MECTIVGAAGVRRKQLRLITWNNSGKYIHMVSSLSMNRMARMPEMLEPIRRPSFGGRLDH